MFKRLLKRNFTKYVTSHVKGSTSTPLSSDTMSKQFYKTALDYPDTLAAISYFQDNQFTYDELYKMATKASANMLDMGVQPGSRVGIYSGNNLEWIITHAACAFADVQMVNINPGYKPNELMYGINKVGIETLIVSDCVKPARILDTIEYLLNETENETKVSHMEDKGNIIFFFIN